MAELQFLLPRRTGLLRLLCIDATVQTGPPLRLGLEVGSLCSTNGSTLVKPDITISIVRQSCQVVSATRAQVCQRLSALKRCSSHRRRSSSLSRQLPDVAQRI